jgi:endo-1,4-beta-xylanase
MINRRSFIRNSALTAAGVSLINANVLASLQMKQGLKDYFKNDFLVGTAIGTRTLAGNDSEMLQLIAGEFNAITTENALKWGPVHPAEGKWDLAVPDKFVEFGLKNKMHIQGHVLVWHSQVSRDLFVDESWKQISKSALLKRMENHISTLVSRYKGKINSWDVVNEAITPADGYRKSKWLEIIGPEFMERAFHLAHEADPDAHLIYNDYGMDNPKRREFVVALVNKYKMKGVPIHGIGMQGHFNLNSPKIKAIEDSIKAFASTGMRVHVTELDVDVLPSKGKRSAEVSTNIKYDAALNPYVNGLPESVNEKLTKRYEEIFELFLKHRDKIDRVTFWGTSDDQSWKNNFPVRGRTNYPLLFDREHKPKEAYFAVVALKQ